MELSLQLETPKYQVAVVQECPIPGSRFASLLGLDRYRYRVPGDTCLSIAVDTGLASVAHGAVSRRDR
jgi:hypothetical protein